MRDLRGWCAVLVCAAVWCARCGAAGATEEAAAAAEEAADADAARLESFYLKLERLNALGEEAGAAAEEAAAEEEAEAAAEEWSERMVATVAAAAPGLHRAQLELLMSDLRAAAAAAASASPPSRASAAAAAYPDDDWHEMEEEYPMDDEEGEGDGDGWDADDDDVSPASRAPAHYANSASADAATTARPGGDRDADSTFEDGAPGAETPQERQQAALQHWMSAQRSTRCAEPRPRTVCVQAEHPHAGKLYLPQCVELHRCGADTGCCSAAQQCAVLRVARVSLPFYVLTVGTSGSTNTEERLPFLNHTRCGCVERAAAAAAEAVAAAAAAEAAAAEAAAVAPGAAGGMARDDADDSTRRPHPPLAAPAHQLEPDSHARARRCKCPREFTPTLVRVGAAEPGSEACACECRPRARDCARLAKGKEYFGMSDRQCIERAECAAPRCVFGAYNRPAGRCPRRRNHRFTSRLL